MIFSKLTFTDKSVYLICKCKLTKGHKILLFIVFKYNRSRTSFKYVVLKFILDYFILTFTDNTFRLTNIFC